MGGIGDSKLIGIKCVWFEQGKINEAGGGVEYVIPILVSNIWLNGRQLTDG